jgi:hypothetical protein
MALLSTALASSKLLELGNWDIIITTTTTTTTCWESA